ncbi:MAG: choice-of-anchor J domain-containing protein, partial [Muribaculaceae bacterium]|nr:choice-of-anchor J domain-containing protein [Muribaculaceae bacterium]
IKNANRDERDIFAVAADDKGTIYALFGAYNYLVTLNPRTGAAERIGRTGLNPVNSMAQGHLASMCYDKANERLLAAVYQEDGYGAGKKRWSGLYEINPSTGETTELYRFDGNASIAGLYVADDAPESTAPAGPVALDMVIDAANPLSGKLVFTAPATSTAGLPLGSNLMALVTLNGVDRVVGDIVPGSTVTVPDMQLAEGNNTVRVVMADSDNRGGSATLDFWAGEDVPGPVGNLMLSVASGVATLSWSAPTEGVNGGALIADNLRYKITRYPDNTVVSADFKGNVFTDNTFDTSWKALYYEVKAYNSRGEAATVTSNKCPAAGALPVPFSETFDTADDFGVWSVINVNGGSTWTFDKSYKCARYDYHTEYIAADDWLVSPPLALKAGQTYKVGYEYRAFNKSYPESFEVFVGRSATVDGLGERIATHSDFINTAFTSGAASFAADEDGDYFVAFHCVSAPKMWAMMIDNVSVDAIDSRVPGLVTELNAVAGDSGALSVSLSFTAPEKDADGGSLASLSRITVSREGKSEPVAVLTDVMPGALLTVKDEAITASALYKYSVVCENELGAGMPATVTVFAGVDVPGKVESLIIGEENRHPVLSWVAPEAGANGGWFDASQLRYRIVRSDGTVLTETLESTSFTDEGYTSPANRQDNVWYLVYAVTEAGRSPYAQTSDLALFGKPYQAPVTETFAGADMALYPWMAQSSNAVNQTWSLDPAGVNPSTADQNGDRGVATFHSVGEPAGTVSDFYSPMISIEELDNPVLSFWMYHSPTIEGDATLEVLASDGGDFVALGEALRRDGAETNGWVRHTYGLEAFAGAARLRVIFRGTGDSRADIFIDNISFESAVATDVALSSFNGPVRVASGVAADYEVKILNAGTMPVADVSVRLTSGGTVLATAAAQSLAPGEEKMLSFPVALDAVAVHTLVATVSCEGDAVVGNNEASLAVNVVTPVIPVPTALAVSAGDDGAVLTWSAPYERGSVTDDIESYAPWIIDGVGEWTMHDGDYDVTAYINYDAGQYENASARKAFQVLDVKRLGIDIWDEGKAHSGNRLLAALSSLNYVNDDWLISPRLNGAEQWVSFYARSFTTDNGMAERMLVHCSSVDTDPANFTPITAQPVVLDGVWREFRYYLPEGTRHFAVNCVSDGAFAMFVDDLTFNDLSVPAWEVTAYEVLRDGKVIAVVPDAGYTDAYVDAKATYSVRAVFGEHGAGPESEAVVYEPAGTTLVSADEAEIDAIYTPSGMKVEGTPSAGVYIIRYTDGSVRKVTM